mmetsp:Transcript_26077/g.85769  ORF Transcript_26077/g.85769 Transcript_26077/m.85769 type:complete len:302 (+) Transcript_26077:134-1039(+)
MKAVGWFALVILSRKESIASPTCSARKPRRSRVLTGVRTARWRAALYSLLPVFFPLFCVREPEARGEGEEEAVFPSTLRTRSTLVRSVSGPTRTWSSPLEEGGEITSPSLPTSSSMTKSPSLIPSGTSPAPSSSCAVRLVRRPSSSFLALSTSLKSGFCWSCLITSATDCSADLSCFRNSRAPSFSSSLALDRISSSLFSNLSNFLRSFSLSSTASCAATDALVLSSSSASRVLVIFACSPMSDSALSITPSRIPIFFAMLNACDSPDTPCSTRYVGAPFTYCMAATPNLESTVARALSWL